MADETYTNKGLTIAFETGDFSTGTVSVLMDLDMRTGTPVDETAWLDGGAAADSYPGAIAGFQAKNSNTTNANGSMRMVTIKATLADAAEQVLVLTEGASKIVSIIGYTYEGTDDALTLTFTNTGTAAYAKTGGALPAIVAHGESAAIFTVTVMLLN